jgi:predicted O-methyltransferase YrrM
LGVELPLYPSGDFYSPISRIEDAMAAKARLAGQYEFPGIDLNLQEQLTLLKKCTPLAAHIPFSEQPSGTSRFYLDNEYFSFSDATIYYLLLRHFQPRRVIEIGSGFSSACLLDTLEHHGIPSTCTFIDPDFSRLKNLLRQEDFENPSRIFLEKKVQEIEPDLFESLEANDFLFIDSTHISKTGSDVNHIVFEVLPSLKPGVIIHFHDFFPQFEYPDEWLLEGVHFNEQYMVRCFLQFNRAFKIMLFMPYLEKFHRSIVEEKLPICLRPHERYSFGEKKGQLVPHILGQSLWLRRDSE